MAEKYRARENNVDNLESVPKKTKKEEREESSAKVAKVVAKGAAEYYAPGIGGKAVDMISQTEAGQKVLNRAGKVLAKNPITGRLSKKLDDSGAVEVADKATDLIGGKPSAGANIGGKTPSNSLATSKVGTPTKTQGSTKSIGSKDPNLSNSNNSNSNSTDALKSDSLNNKSSNNNDIINNLLGNGSVLKLVKTKFLIISVGVFFGFVLLMTLFMSAKDFGNLDLTNNSEAMGSYSPEVIGLVSLEGISNIDDSAINGGNSKILTGGNTLYSIMGNEGVALLNEKIKTSAEMAGYGTGGAPAAAAQALIQNLLNIDVILPYFWGGGHASIPVGADGNWGTYTKVTAGWHITSFSTRPLGLDCSGFVSWALYNGGCKSFTPITAADFKNLGPEISFSNAKMGDIAASNSHVVLILENRGDNLLVAEAKGTAYGVVFSLRNERNLKRYKIIDMSSYYQVNCS